MGDWLRIMFSILIWPGFLVAALLGWLYLWLGRKLTARLQGRQGPPFYQPFFDFIKLLGKRTVISAGIPKGLFYGLPIVAVVSVVIALALLPLPMSAAPSFSGDLVLVIYLLEMPAVCMILAGYVSRSLYGQVSASREAVLLLGYNLPFLAAVIAVAMNAHSLQLSVMAHQPWGPVHFVAALTFLVSVPARMRSNPFSIPNAEQEIVAGSMTEFNGVPLALFELAHGLELVALIGLFNVLFVPAAGGWLASLLVYLLVSVVLVGLLTCLAVVTARLRINQAFRFYWLWGALGALVSFMAAVLFRS
jgi:NADH-quinone oxidoreductase subunit H